MTPTNNSTLYERTDEILDAARYLFGQRGSSWEQFRRYTIEHLAWCRAEGIEPPVDAATRQRYRAYLAEEGKVTSQQSWKVRATVLNKLPAVIGELVRRDRVSTARHRTRFIDGLPARSALRGAIEELVEGKPPAYRASLRADLAVALEWCRHEGLDPQALGRREIALFERWISGSGRRSRGPISAARWLHRRFYEPEQWWR